MKIPLQLILPEIVKFFSRLDQHVPLASIMKLPDFNTEEEELNFWKKHSISNYWEDLKEADDTFQRPKLTPV